MGLAQISTEDGIATVTLARGKVNAIDEAGVEELRECLGALEQDPAVRAVVLTGRGKFFSFGFDIPGFLDYSKEAFIGYLTKFTELYHYLFMFPKPVVAALNGHTVAGGCMLATACDLRLMVTGKARVSLNEITFGASVFAGAVETLRCCTGHKNAQQILYSGAMYSAVEAHSLGLVDEVTTAEELSERALAAANELAARAPAAFASIKRLLRRSAAEEGRRREHDSILEFVDIWYSEGTWRNLQKIKIHS